MSSKIPKAPDHLNDEALLEWERVTGEMTAAGQIEKWDRALLTTYCEAWQAKHAFAIQLGIKGPLGMTTCGHVGTTAAWKGFDRAALLVSKLLNQLGLTPEARGIQQEKESSELEF